METPTEASAESGARRSHGAKELDPPLASRPPSVLALRPQPEADLEVLLLRPQHPAPEMPGMQIEQNLFSLCVA